MEPHDDPPWSIPIRDASDAIPHRSASVVDRLPVLPVAVGAVLLFVGVVAAVVLVGNDPATPESSPEVMGEQAPDPTTAPPDANEPPPEPEPTTTTEAPVTTTSTPPASPARADSRPAAPVDGEPEGLPIHGPDTIDGGWVAQVSSVPSSAGGNALARAYETVTATVPDAVILRGGEWAPLRDGFFVIVRTGFDSAADAVEACDASGRTGRDECFARFLSSVDDTQRTCWRDEGGALAGDCG